MTIVQKVSGNKNKIHSMKRTGLIILAVILALLLIGVGIWAYRLNSDKTALTAENDKLSTELSDLEDLKENLEVEVDSLLQAYDVLAEENEVLQGSLTEAENKLANKDYQLQKEKKKNASEINNLRAEIQGLLSVKSELEGRINQLEAENDSLKTVTGILEQDLNLAREENEALANLNAAIQEEVKQLTLANFKASAFQVELERKKSKLTSKSKKVRKIRVTFDLANVPDKYQALRPLYMVITDEKATPIQVASPIQAKVNINGQDMDIQAVEAKNVDIVANQRLSMSHDLEDKLRLGYYRVSIYTDIGLLGASSFRLQ